MQGGAIAAEMRVYRRKELQIDATGGTSTPQAWAKRTEQGRLARAAATTFRSTSEEGCNPEQTDGGVASPPIGLIEASRNAELRDVFVALKSAVSKPSLKQVYRAPQKGGLGIRPYSGTRK